MIDLAVLNMALEQYGCGGFEAEYRFRPARRWRFDYAWPDKHVALEVDGAVWTQGRHTRGSGFIRDCEKMTAAAVDGWRVLRVTTWDIENRMSYVVESVKEALR